MFSSFLYSIITFTIIHCRLQQELSDLKIEAGNQKKLIQEQKKIIDQLQKNQPIKNAQVYFLPFFFFSFFIII